MLNIEITDRDGDTICVEGAETMAEATKLVNGFYGEYRCECWFIYDEETDEILAQSAY